MKTNTQRLLAAASFALASLFGSAAHAQVSTGTLTGWGVFGDVVSRFGAITLTTAYLDGDVAGDQPFNLSGNSPIAIGDLETAAGVAPYALDLSAAEYGTEGSLVKQSFAAVAGQTLSFDWSFGTLDTLFQDRAFVVIDGEVITLATANAPGGSTQSFSRTFAQSGNVTLSFGVIDTVDYLGVSSLAISNLALGDVAAPVPEPSTWALFGGGLALLGWHSRRRARV
jgi:PEP-CTERM motif